MNTGYAIVPFKSEKHSGLAEINGIAKFSPAGIVFEFESKLLGLFAGGVKEVRLPKSEILDVTFRKGLFKRSGKLEIRVNSFFKLSELPNSEGKMILKILKADFERCEAAITLLQEGMIGHEMETVPPHTPVEQLFADETEDETKPL